ncbi:MAG: 2Fe-2S iron-sulfur cluster-binding protein [Myxococcota bacterium]|nr:2Fe-2S iron-sulfur cluster-binding protein [Myxococcota bacterium]
MSRFRIRKKLKGLLGSSPQEIVRHEITYLLPDGTEQKLMAEEHYSLLMAADANNITISTGRRAGGTCPDGLCGLCRVQVVEGTGLSVLSEYEQKAMDDQVAGTPHEGRNREPGLPLEPGTRLGCHTKIRGPGAVVQIPALFDPESISGETAEA